MNPIRFISVAPAILMAASAYAVDHSPVALSDPASRSRRPQLNHGWQGDGSKSVKTRQSMRRELLTLKKQATSRSSGKSDQ